MVLKTPLLSSSHNLDRALRTTELRRPMAQPGAVPDVLPPVSQQCLMPGRGSEAADKAVLAVSSHQRPVSKI